MGPEAQAASPIEQLRGFFSAATRILDPQTDEGLEARLAAIRAIVKEIVDVPAAAQLSLGPNWNARTAAERDGVRPAVRRPAGALADRRDRRQDPSPRRHPGQLSSASPSTGAVATVWTTLLSKRGLDLPFTYRMIARTGRWAICDVVIDGVSVAANYRAQFLRIMQVLVLSGARPADAGEGAGDADGTARGDGHCRWACDRVGGTPPTRPSD